MRRLPVTVGGRTYQVVRHDDGTFEMPPELKALQGWDVALKPGHEPIVVARRPLAGTVVANVLEHDTGALNIDSCRVAFRENDTGVWGGQQHPDNHRSVPGGHGTTFDGGPIRSGVSQRNDMGRWPANVVLDEAAADELDRQSGATPSNARRNKGSGMGYHGADGVRGSYDLADSGGASRFFPVFRYEPKADALERPIVVDGVRHPTVKPLALMRWLVRLVTPPGGTVLDPFLGSGTTAEACLLERFRCIGIEREADYLPLIRQRVDRHRDARAYLESKGELEDTLFAVEDGEA